MQKNRRCKDNNNLTWSMMRIDKSLKMVLRSPIDCTICDISSSLCFTNLLLSSTIVSCAVVKP